jgi:hypothetical protein
MRREVSEGLAPVRCPNSLQKCPGQHIHISTSTLYMPHIFSTLSSHIALSHMSTYSRTVAERLRMVPRLASPLIEPCLFGHIPDSTPRRDYLTVVPSFNPARSPQTISFYVGAPVDHMVDSGTETDYEVCLLVGPTFPTCRYRD